MMLIFLAVVLGIKVSPKTAAGWLTAFFVVGSVPIGNGAALLGTLPLAVVFFPVSYAVYWMIGRYWPMSRFNQTDG